MKICLILSGGGSNGIVQVGYCKYFYERGIEFEVITGTSTGSLQGAMYAQGRYDNLLKIWHSIKSHKDIYRHHIPFSYVQGIFMKSLYSAAPLRKKINEYVDIDTLINSKQKFTSCSTNITTNTLKYVKSIEENREIIKDFIYASAAFPTAFEPLLYNGEYFWDGGLMEPIPVKEAVTQCPDADYYIIGLTNPIYENISPNIGKTLLGFGLRTQDAMFKEIWLGDLKIGMSKHWGEKFKILAPPKPPFPSSLEWYPEMYNDKIEEGYQLAREALKDI